MRALTRPVDAHLVLLEIDDKFNRRAGEDPFAARRLPAGDKPHPLDELVER